VTEAEIDATTDATTAPPVNGAIAAAYEDARLRILRSLERGEIDVAEAGRRLEALDAGAGAEETASDETVDADDTADADTIAWSADEGARG
jgi:hypothetical protein